MAFGNTVKIFLVLNIWQLAEKTWKISSEYIVVDDKALMISGLEIQFHTERKFKEQIANELWEKLNVELT